MPQTNVIINGTFDQGSNGWSGTDIETNYPEGLYLGTSSTNAVAELDGTDSLVTVMEQTFTLTDTASGTLSLDVALRTASLSEAGNEGFTLEILDSSGGVLASMTVLPTVAVFNSISLDVDFPAAGDYTLRMSELGINDSLGAIIDNVALLICFGGDTRIDTPGGARKAREIRAGDMVLTEHGPRRVRWAGRRAVDQRQMAADARFQPVRISAGALGDGLPKRDILVSRQHRFLVNSPVTQRMFGVREVLVPAIRLTALPGIYIDESVREIDYVHLLLDDHEIVFAEGAPSETLLLGPDALRALTPAGRDEIALLFPEATRLQADLVPARPIPERKRQKRMLDRMATNRRPVLEY